MVTKVPEGLRDEWIDSYPAFARSREAENRTVPSLSDYLEALENWAQMYETRDTESSRNMTLRDWVRARLAAHERLTAPLYATVIEPVHEAVPERTHVGGPITLWMQVAIAHTGSETDIVDAAELWDAAWNAADVDGERGSSSSGVPLVWGFDPMDFIEHMRDYHQLPAIREIRKDGRIVNGWTGVRLTDYQGFWLVPKNARLGEKTSDYEDAGV